MKIVIQCAGRKENTAETFTMNGIAHAFVAKPGGVNQVRPWDEISTLAGKTWIDCVQAYRNKARWEIFQQAGIGVSGSGQLLECGRLYLPDAYTALISSFGKENVYILSAGWGLVRADVRIPMYDVTFSTATDVCQCAKITPRSRSKYPSISDDIPGDDAIHFFMTPKYVEYWSKSFSGEDGDRQRYVFHWLKGAKNLPAVIHGGNVIWHELGDMRTNWHYAAVGQFLSPPERQSPGI